MESRELVNVSTKVLDTQLYGKKRRWWRRREDYALVNVAIFEDVGFAKVIDEGHELRRRHTGSTDRGNREGE